VCFEHKVTGIAYVHAESEEEAGTIVEDMDVLEDSRVTISSEETEIEDVNPK